MASWLFLMRRCSYLGLTCSVELALMVSWRQHFEIIVFDCARLVQANELFRRWHR